MKYIAIIVFFFVASSVSFAEDYRGQYDLRQERQEWQDQNRQELLRQQYRSYDAQQRLSEQLRYERFNREIEEQRRRDYFLYGR
jgi:hypothetical protein